MQWCVKADVQRACRILVVQQTLKFRVTGLPKRVMKSFSIHSYCRFIKAGKHLPILTCTCNEFSPGDFQVKAKVL